MQTFVWLKVVDGKAVIHAECRLPSSCTFEDAIGQLASDSRENMSNEEEQKEIRLSLRRNLRFGLLSLIRVPEGDEGVEQYKV